MVILALSFMSLKEEINPRVGIINLHSQFINQDKFQIPKAYVCRDA